MECNFRLRNKRAFESCVNFSLLELNWVGLYLIGDLIFHVATLYKLSFIGSRMS